MTVDSTLPTRDALLKAGLAAFEESGYSGARLADIVAGADLTTGAFYRHFENKLDFYNTLQDRYAEEVEAALGRGSGLGDQIDRWLALARASRGLVRATHELARPGSAEAEKQRRERDRLGRLLGEPLADLVAEADLVAPLGRTLYDIVTQYVLLESLGWLPERPTADISSSLDLMVRKGLYLRAAGSWTPMAGAVTEASGASRRAPISWQPAPGRSHATTRRGRKTRERILRSAIVVFGKRGFAEVSMLDIAANAKLASGTVYQYFEDKEDVFGCLLQELSERLYDETRMPADAHGRLIVEQSVVTYLAVYREYAPIFRAWWELMDPRTPFTELWVELHRLWYGQMLAVIDRGRRRGVIGKRINPDVVAELIVCTFDRPAYTRIVLGWDDGPDDELVSIMSRLLGRGFGSTSV